MKAAGIVVLYNPADSVFDNIQTYIDDLECVYAIDNSDTANNSLIEKLKSDDKIKYISLDKNMGLAYALNYGCEQAENDGFEYVLTMDQDSILTDGSLKILKQRMEKENGKYAIVCPNVFSCKDNEILYKDIPEETETNPEWAITSGSLMSLEAYNAVGRFDDKLFVGHIDRELGYLLKKSKYNILKIGNAVLLQRFGNSEPKKLLWKTVYVSNDSFFRIYYNFRNQKYLLLKHGKDVKKVLPKMRNTVVEIILFEDNKIKRLNAAFRGYRDSKNLL